MNKVSYVHQLFSSLADHYDLLNSLLTLNRDKQWRKFTASLAELNSPGIALDVATGTGELALELARKMTGKGKVLRSSPSGASQRGEAPPQNLSPSPYTAGGLYPSAELPPGGALRGFRRTPSILAEGDKGSEVYKQPAIRRVLGNVASQRGEAPLTKSSPSPWERLFNFDFPFNCGTFLWSSPLYSRVGTDLQVCPL